MPIVGHYVWPMFLDFVAANEIHMAYAMVGLSIVWHTIVIVSINLVFLVVYKLNHPFFEKYKTNDDLWPWQENMEEWKRFRMRAAKILFLNIMIIFPVSLALRTKVFNWAVPFATKTEDIPDSLTFFLQVLFMFVLEDFVFHLVHRAAHWRVIYPYIHKIHHEFKVTLSISAEYAHPLDYIFSNLIPSMMGANMLG